MTIKEIVLSNPVMGINGWLNVAKQYKMNSKEEKILIDCAEYFNKVEVNHNASFIKAINA